MEISLYRFRGDKRNYQSALNRVQIAEFRVQKLSARLSSAVDGGGAPDSGTPIGTDTAYTFIRCSSRSCWRQDAQTVLIAWWTCK